jgi:hypothetical protein
MSLDQYKAPDREVRTEEQAVHICERLRMPVELRSVALARWREARGIKAAPPSTEELRQKLNAQLAKDDAQRRAQVEALGKALGKEIRAAEDDGEDGEPDEQDLQDMMDEMYQDRDGYQYVGSTDTHAFCLDGDQLMRHSYGMNSDGDLVLGPGERMSPSLDEISSLRKRLPALEAAQLRHAEKMKYRHAR